MKLFLGGLAVLLFSSSWARGDDVLQSFVRQQTLIDQISDLVGREDLPALLAIRSSISAVIDDVNANRIAKRKPVTFETLVKIQGLVIQYSFNQVLLGFTDPPALSSIYTIDQAESLKELGELSSRLKIEYGFDRSFFTVITANIFKQMQKLLAQAELIALDPQIKVELRALWPLIGRVASIGALGDRPNTFAAAKPVVEKLRTLYPLFDSVSSSDVGFPVVLEIKGLVEFYAEYAQQE